ncbi:MAG: iron ABC transporter permease [Actinobacteria bacterium]|nr:iron ABC transporter permease [Actinomycetota bacterium]
MKTSRSTNRRRPAVAWLTVGYSIAVTFSIIVALNFGAAHLDHLWHVLLHPNDGAFAAERDILWQIRIPRIITALFIGAALGVAGVMAQGAVNNPLAEPAILGTSAGAAFGVLIGLLFNLATIGSISAIVFGIVGGVAASFITFYLSKSRDGQASVVLIIVGIAVSASISAFVGITTSMVSRPDARSVSFWTWGSLALTTNDNLKVLIPIVIAGVVIAWAFAPRLDLLSLGDSTARNIGLDPRRVRRVAIFTLSILVAASVSTVGFIAFLGLAAPHIGRLGFGPRHRPLVLHSALIGSLILLVADTGARTLAAPQELPIGLITALIGAPILILLVRRNLELWRQQ